MNQTLNLQKLKGLSYFDKNTLSQFVELSDSSLYTTINRWVKSGKIIQLKKGLYVTDDYVEKLSGKQAYMEFIANKLKFPSYLSLEYVLQKHSVLSESVFAITSITLKSKRTYKNKLGTYIYKSIKDDLFVGHTTVKSGSFEIKEAVKSKALFDYLYLKLFRIEFPDKDLINSFRLNLDEFSQNDKKEFDAYCQLSGINKYKTLPSLVFNI